MTFLDALKRFGPIAALAAGPYAPLVLVGIGIAEESGKPSKDKKKIAIQASKAAAGVLNAVKQEQIVDPNQVADITASVVDQVVSAINELKDADKLPEPHLEDILDVTVTTAKVTPKK